MKWLALAMAAALTPDAHAAGTAAPRYPAAASSDFGQVRLFAEKDAGAPVSGLQIFVEAGLNRETASTSGLAALVAECILRTPAGMPGARDALQPLAHAVASAGGSITYTVDARSVHYYLEARSDKLASLVALFAAAASAPDFSPATVTAARASLSSRAAELERNALEVAIAMFRRSFYAGGSGAQALGTTASLAGLSAAQAKAFYATTYSRRGLRASVVGEATPGLGGALKALADALPDAPLAVVPVRTKTIPVEAPRIIAHRDVSAPWVVVGFAAPSPASRDFGAMLVLQSLLSDAFERHSTTTLGLVEKSVGAFYLYDAAPASLAIYVNGARIDSSQAVGQLLAVVHSLAIKPLGGEALGRFKTIAEGRFVTDSVTLSDRSYLLGTFAAQGLGSDGMNAALAALEVTSPADVQRTAKTYLQRYIVALVLPRANAR